MAERNYEKDPDAILDWVWDWSRWLEAGETIATSEYITSAGINVDSDEKASTNTTVWLSGGRPGQPYRITNRITTSGGRTDDRSITIRVTDR